jgi:hypothetical protein
LLSGHHVESIDVKAYCSSLTRRSSSFSTTNLQVSRKPTEFREFHVTENPIVGKLGLRRSPLSRCSFTVSFGGFQRSFDCSPDTLRAELVKLAVAYPAALKQAEQSDDGEFRIGGWIGSVAWQAGASVDHSLVAVVHTFLPPEMSAAA